MAATHVQEQADTIIGQNSGGADDNLFIVVSRQQYVEAWLVDPCIVDTAVSTQDSKQLRIQPPAKSLEWDMLVNKIWNKPRWRIIGSTCAVISCSTPGEAIRCEMQSNVFQWKKSS